MKNIIAFISIVVFLRVDFLYAAPIKTDGDGFFDVASIWNNGDTPPGSGEDFEIANIVTIRNEPAFSYGAVTLSNKLTIGQSGDDPEINVTFGALTFSGPGNTLEIYGNLTVASITVTSNTNNIIVHPGASLNVTGNISLSGTGAELTVSNEGAVDIDGSFSIGNNSTATIDGNLTADGGIDNSGTMDVGETGSVTVPPPAEITGNGNINNDGTIDADYTGTGTVTGNNFLPIKLISFSAQKNANVVTLKWTTATEESNDYFSIERSADGINYGIIGSIAGAGNSSTALSYQYIDNNPLQGVSYYRLSQTDYNGDSETFDAVSVALLNEAGISVGPNPASNYLNVAVDGELGYSEVNIYNLIGAQVKSIVINETVTTISVNDLPKGAYMVVLSANTSRVVKRIIIQ